MNKGFTRIGVRNVFIITGEYRDEVLMYLTTSTAGKRP